MGMALHAAPGLLRCALLEVPFLDVLGAMADPSLPLTARERPEWGDPTASQVGGRWSGGCRSSRLAIRGRAQLWSAGPCGVQAGR